MVEPDRSRAESYSWATAPRYGDDDRVMQLGPLPELLIAGDPLAADLVAVHGTSAFVRQLVRWTRAAASLRLMRQWLDELESCLGQPTLQPPRGPQTSTTMRKDSATPTPPAAPSCTG
jgi:Ni,Fe-hydrogenase I large subunit